MSVVEYRSVESESVNIKLHYMTLLGDRPTSTCFPFIAFKIDDELFGRPDNIVWTTDRLHSVTIKTSKNIGKRSDIK